MKVPQASGRSEVGANMTPMIDVVFLLIIFFLVSSHLARQENRLPVELPVATTFLPDNPERTSLTITVDAETRWRVGGDIVDQSQWKSILVNYRNESGNNASVRLRTDGTVPYQFIEPILRESAIAGISDITIAVREGER
ncbi:Biopolymer transport protein ExbD [Planctomycetes bacterium CA13]|uniref:Biopolymer transport protein ExbD n=1 Tax=Novipirellula herctigrandis TaxID=2527986 RepID=A0A5C5Z619_9BACT|nr:Biopolymer transport protein ExbD [Planctomycetes bacterium CA13]